MLPNLLGNLFDRFPKKPCDGRIQVVRLVCLCLHFSPIIGDESLSYAGDAFGLIDVNNVSLLVLRVIGECFCSEARDILYTKLQAYGKQGKALGPALAKSVSA